MVPLLLAGMAPALTKAAPEMAMQGLSYLTDPNRIYNAIQQKKIKGEIDRGEGISSVERQSMGNAAMQPVRAMAGGVASEQARAQAASSAGGVGGGAAIQGIRQAQQEAVARGAGRVGLGLGAANQAGLDAKKDELAKRVANAAEMRNQMLSGMVDTYGEKRKELGQQDGAVPGTFNSDLGAMGAAQPAATPARQSRQPAPSIMPTDTQLEGDSMDLDPSARMRAAGAAFMDQGAATGAGPGGTPSYVAPQLGVDLGRGQRQGEVSLQQMAASIPPERRVRFAEMVARNPGLAPEEIWKLFSGDQTWAPQGLAPQSMAFAPQSGFSGPL